MIGNILRFLRSKGYEADGEKFQTGRTTRFTLPLITREGLCVVAKYYPSGGGDSTFINMKSLWQSSFGEQRQPPGIPRPIEYFDEANILIMERIKNRTFSEINPHDLNVLDASIRLLAEFHECDAKLGKRFGSQKIKKSIRRKAEVVATVEPQFSNLYWQAFEALNAIQVKDVNLVPSHGDFSLKNILVGDEGLVLIDLDRLRWADPARDIAFMGCGYWFRSLRDRKSSNWSVLRRIIKVYGSLRPGALIEDHMNFHVAAGLLRMAHSRAGKPGNERDLIPKLIRGALSQLQ